MTPPILGLHHVTATVDDAQQDLDFCGEALGLRLVKKTVNFDNHHVYHFYYGDERGHARHAVDDVSLQGPRRAGGHERRGADHVDGVFGAGRIARRSGRTRLRERGIDGAATRRRDSARSRSRVTDPSGLAFELVANDRDDAHAVDGRRHRRGVRRSRPAQRHDGRAIAGQDTGADDGSARLHDRERSRRADPRGRQRRRARQDDRDRARAGRRARR